MKKLAWIVTFVLLLSACGVGQEAIIRYVEKNQTELEQVVAEQRTEPFGIIEHIYVREGYVEFSCAAAGWGSETSYQGFFWSAADDPFGYWAPMEEADFVREGDGWLWIQPEGDNLCYVEHICGQFYYYEEHY